MAGYSCPPVASAHSPPLHAQQSDPSELGHTRTCTPSFCIVTPPRRCRTRGPRPCRAAPARCSACSCSSACCVPASRALARACCARAEPRPSHRVHLRASQCLHTPPAPLGSRAGAPATRSFCVCTACRLPALALLPHAHARHALAPAAASSPAPHIHAPLRLTPPEPLRSTPRAATAARAPMLARS
jgi:hypothetical protein